MLQQVAEHMLEVFLVYLHGCINIPGRCEVYPDAFCRFFGYHINEVSDGSLIIRAALV